MSKLKVGDRIVVYLGMYRHKTTVKLLGEKDTIHFEPHLETPDSTYSMAHVKQCRRIVSKPRRRVWIDSEYLRKGVENVVGDTVCVGDDNGTWIEFVEVKKK